MAASDSPQFTSLAFLWPALAAKSASEFASAAARGFSTSQWGPSRRVFRSPSGRRAIVWYLSCPRYVCGTSLRSAREYPP